MKRDRISTEIIAVNIFCILQGLLIPFIALKRAFFYWFHEMAQLYRIEKIAHDVYTKDIERRFPEKKYIVIEGYVQSKTDGDTHFITCYELARLYGVKPEECYFQKVTSPNRGVPAGLIVLRPKFNGDYSLPKENENEKN